MKPLILILVIMLFSVSVNAQFYQGWIQSDSTAVLLGATDTEDTLYVHFDELGQPNLVTSWTSSQVENQTMFSGEGSVFIYPDTIGTGVEMDSLEVIAAPCDNYGNVAADAAYLDFSSTNNIIGTSRATLDYTAETWYYCRINRYHAIYGIRFRILHFSSGGSDSLSIPFKFVTRK